MSRSFIFDTEEGMIFFKSLTSWNLIYYNLCIEWDHLCFVAEENEAYGIEADLLLDGIKYQKFKSLQKLKQEESKEYEEDDGSPVSRNSWASLVNQCFNSGKLKRPKNLNEKSKFDMSSISDKQSSTIEIGNFITEKYSTDEMDPPQKFLRTWGWASVLIVDDSPFNLLILNEIFSKIIPQKYTQKSELNTPQFKINEASNGKQALNKVKETEGKQWWNGYELILMDLSMPTLVLKKQPSKNDTSRNCIYHNTTFIQKWLNENYIKLIKKTLDYFLSKFKLKMGFIF